MRGIIPADTMLERAGYRLMNDDLEEFLRNVGFALELRRGPEGEPFGDWIIQYGNKDLEVALICDRKEYGVYVADKHTLRPTGILPPAPAQYDVDLIRELLSGEISAPMDYADQKAFTRAHWSEITAMFAHSRREATHQQLKVLADERMKRTFNPWPPAILEFETFMQANGMTCQTREAPKGIMGTRLMEYTGPRVNVRIDSTGGWRLLFADAAGPVDTWYDIVTLKGALPGGHPSSIKFPEWFTFAASHWDAICRMFDASQRDATHPRLAPLEEETRKRRAEFRAEQDARIKALEDAVREDSNCRRRGRGQ